MQKNLPARPNLDHLRRQAKTLLASLAIRDQDAVSIILQHLPAAKEMTAAEILTTHYCLADAQWAIARKTGFATWPHLARHVEQLRALEGVWSFGHLEIDGGKIPANALTASRILIDGDRFRTESPEANYEGIFNINVEAEPHGIDIEFIAGPEAGNSNFGIFRLQGDRLELWLDLHGKPRPEAFATTTGSGHAYETLKRTSFSRPENVSGGVAPTVTPAPKVNQAIFAYVESPTLTRLQGNWTAVKIIRDGQELPAMMLRAGLRTATKNEVSITFGGQTMIHALIRLDESTDPMQVDYYNVAGACSGTVQHGVFKWVGDDACFCTPAPGEPRPADFTCAPGSQRTFSQWRLKK